MVEEDMNVEVGTEEVKQGEFAIQKIYTKDIFFETPHSPEIFTAEWEPVVNMNLNSEAKPIADKTYEVVLIVTVNVTVKEKTAYLVEAHQAGIFHIDKFPEEVIRQMMATICPDILFPFAREHVADMVARGGFPQLLLAPVNFEALYQKQKMQQQNAVSKTQTKH